MQAAILPDEEHYLDVGVGSMVRRRVPWLLGLLGAESLVVVFLQRYDATLTAAIALAFFVPVLIATGGNTGTQTAALVIRALATGEAELSDVWRIAGRDVLVGVLLSTILGFAMFSLSMLVYGDPVIGLCVSLGLAAIVSLSNIVGTLLPLLFKKLGMDPALMSGPFISTIIDLLGLVVYMEISVSILRSFGKI
jgi:magnesium transporter